MYNIWRYDDGLHISHFLCKRLKAMTFESGDWSQKVMKRHLIFSALFYIFLTSGIRNFWFGAILWFQEFKLSNFHILEYSYPKFKNFCFLVGCSSSKKPYHSAFGHWSLSSLVQVKRLAFSSARSLHVLILHFSIQTTSFLKLLSISPNKKSTILTCPIKEKNIFIKKMQKIDLLRSSSRWAIEILFTWSSSQVSQLQKNATFAI